MCRKLPPSVQKVVGPVLSSSPTMMANSITDEAILVMERRFLQRLKGVSFKEVEGVVAGATRIYKAIQRLGGDPSVLQAMVDVYADKVKEFLRAKENTLEQNDANVSKVQAQLQTAKKVLEKAVERSEDLKMQLSGVTDERLKLEELLEACKKKELDLGESYCEQLQAVTSAESKVSSLQREMEELEKALGARTNLDEMERNLEKNRDSLDEAI